MAITTVLLSVIIAPDTFAQTPDTASPETTAPAAQAPAQQAEPTIPQSTTETPTAVDAPGIDLTDPAIREALEAREKADRAIADAVNAQRKANAAEISDTTEAEKRPSIIPKNAEDAKALGKKILEKIIEALTSIPFLAQVGAIVLAYFLSPLAAKQVRSKVFLFNEAPVETTKYRLIRDYIYQSRVFLRAVFLVAFLAILSLILKNIPVAGQTIFVKLAQGLAVVFLLYKAIETFAPNDLLKKLAIWTLIPIALMMTFGYFDNFTGALKSTELMRMGDTPITLMTMVQLAIFGALFFKLGGIANNKGQTAIRSQEGLDSSTREVISKIFQIVLFIIIFILVMGAAKVPLSGLVVIFSALSLGIGLGLQPVAANFVSGMIILFDRTVRVGDYVVLPDGQEGHVEAINMRSTTVETTDGKDIMVPNTTFIENAYENWTHKDPRQRYEVYFTVDFDTDIDTLEDIIIPAVSAHPSVLQEPEEPDLELREFGDNGIKFAVEFWCSGIDDGPNKFTSDLNFIIWRTLRDNKIKIPFPQRVVQMKK